MVVKTGSGTLKEDNIRWKQNERVPVTSEQIPHSPEANKEMGPRLNGES